MSKIYMFVSYSRRDEIWVKEGEKFGLIPWLAKSLARRDVEIWYDHALREMPGEDYTQKIKDEIDRAQFAILLLSQDFLDSDFIRRYEMPWIKERVDRDEMAVIPILVDHTLWEFEDELKWITGRQMLPGSPTPLIEYTVDVPRWKRVRLDILRAILSRIHESQEAIPKPDSDSETLGTAPPAISTKIEVTETDVAPDEVGDAEEIQEPRERESAVGELRLLGHHGSMIDAIAVTPDGRRAVTASSDRTLKVWDLESGRESHVLSGHSADVLAVAVTRDGQRAYSVSVDRTLIVWDLETGAQLRTDELVESVGAPVPLVAVAVAPDGQRAVSARLDRILHTWDLERGRSMTST